jgi:hypothetical protein
MESLFYHENEEHGRESKSSPGRQAMYLNNALVGNIKALHETWFQVSYTEHEGSSFL